MNHEAWAKNQLTIHKNLYSPYDYLSEKCTFANPLNKTNLLHKNLKKYPPPRRKALYISEIRKFNFIKGNKWRIKTVYCNNVFIAN